MRAETAAAAEGIGSLRLLDFVLFFLLVSGIGVDVGTYSTNLVLAAIVFVALFKRPVFDLGRYQVVPVAFTVMLTYVGLVSLFADQGGEVADWRTRLLRMAVVAMLVMVVATGRIDLRSAIYGFCSALLLNVPLFFLGLVPAPYGEYLTGFVGDKNVSGLVYCVFGILAIAIARRNSHRVALALVFGGCVWLTGSRTSIAAFIAGCGWMLLAPKLNLAGRWLLGAVTAYLVSVTAEDFSQIGVFSGREGSDELRARIDEASLDKVQATGFFGQGLGEAWVPLEDDRWLFHNSYWTALVEGGWPWALFIVALTALIMLRPFKATLSSREVKAMALGVAVLICATRLGEVFFTVYWAIPLAYGIQIALPKRDLDVGASVPADDPRLSRATEKGAAGG